MRKRRAFGLGLIVTGLVVGATALWYLLTNGTIEVRISQETAQQKVTEKMPIDKSAGPLHYHITGAAIDLRADGRVGVVADVKAELGRRMTHGSMTGSGMVRYDDGAFYIVGFDAEKIDLHVDQPLAAAVPDVPPTAGKRLRDAIKEKAAEALEKSGLDDEIKAYAAAKKEEIVERVKPVAVSMIRNTLEHHKVYELKPTDTKKAVAKLMLKDVRVEQGTLVVTLDPLTALIRVVTMIMIGVLSVIVGFGFLMALAQSGGGAAIGAAAAVSSMFD